MSLRPTGPLPSTTQTADPGALRTVDPAALAEAYLQANPSALFAVDPDRRILRWNRRAEEITGYPESHILGRSCLEFSLAPCRERCGLFDPTVLKPIRARECRIVTRAGEVRTIRKNAVLLSDPAGRPICGIESFEDVTDLRRAEAEAALARDRAGYYLDLAGTLLVGLDPEGRISIVNRAACELLGWPEAELTGADWFERCLPESCRQETRRFFDAAMSGREELPRHHENPVVTQTGAIRQIAWHNQVLRSHDGQITGTFSSGLDQTERLEAEARALELVEETHRARSTFLANVSHELRTPLNGILGTAQLLAEEPLTDGQATLVRHLRENADRLCGLLVQVLELTRGEAESAVTLGAVRPGALCEELYRAHGPAAAGKGVGLSFEIAGGTPEAVALDAERVRAILDRLVENAIRFTPSGSVVVRVDAAPDPSSGDRILLGLEVADTGVGIARKEQERIFAPFHQVEGSAGRAGGGLGLGLALVRQSVLALGGRIGVQSARGRGSTFRVELPAVRACVDDAAPGAAAPGAPTRRLHGRTGHPDEEHRAARLAAGTDAHLATPVRGAALGEARASLTRAREGRAGLEVVRGARLPAADPVTGPGERPCAPEQALAMLGGDQAAFRELVRLFDADSRRLLAELLAALASRDGPTAARAAHTLKGTAGTFAAEPLISAAKAVDVAVRAADWEAAEAVFPRVERALEVLLVALGDALPYETTGDDGLRSRR